MILAIDPGSRRLGWAVASDQAIVACGAVDVEGRTLAEIGAAVRELAATWEADRACVEVPDGSMVGVRSLVATARLHMVVGAVAVGAGVPCDLVLAGDVKMALAGRRTAKKHEVHAVLILAGVEIPPLKRQTCPDCRAAGGRHDHSPDAADAAGLAWYALNAGGVHP